MGIFRKLRVFIINQLGFSTKEANGVLILFSIILILIIFSNISVRNPGTKKDESAELRAWAAEIAQLKERNTGQDNIALSPFDPNNASVDQLLSVGFSQIISNRIVKYRESGGVFRNADDLKKIYGMDENFLSKVRPFVKIREHIQTVDMTKSEIRATNNSTTSTPLEESKVKIDLNTAIAEDLQKIRGIGQVLSTRTIKYRNLLGGFTSFSQLKEVYGLSDTLISAFEYEFYLDSTKLDEITINTDSIIHLSKHPYINFNLARAIVNYRKANGEYKSVEDIRQIKIMTDSLYQKLYPYLSIQP